MQSNPPDVMPASDVFLEISHVTDRPPEDDSLQVDLSSSLNKQKNKFEKRQQKQSLLEASDNHAMRQTFAVRIFKFMTGWMIVVVMLAFLQGFQFCFLPDRFCGGFHLSENVLIALFVTTTINVLGIFGIVAKWLFNASPKN